MEMLRVRLAVLATLAVLFRFPGRVRVGLERDSDRAF
jgi:hypothetical protein